MGRPTLQCNFHPHRSDANQRRHPSPKKQFRTRARRTPTALRDAQLRHNARRMRCLASDPLRAWTQLLVRDGRKRMAHPILAPPPAMAHGFR